VPLARYLIFVGGTLAVLLVIGDRCLPMPPAMFAKQLAIDRSIIRIKSAHEWPEKIVLDTSHPTTTPPAVEESPVAQSVRLPPEEAGDQSNLEALAQLKPDTSSAAVDHPMFRIKRSLARPLDQSVRPEVPLRINRQERRRARAVDQLGWIDDAQTSPNAMSRRNVASWPMDRWALSGRN
jgi:hypothetical protein